MNDLHLCHLIAQWLEDNPYKDYMVSHMGTPSRSHSLCHIAPVHDRYIWICKSLPDFPDRVWTTTCHLDPSDPEFFKRLQLLLEGYYNKHIGKLKKLVRK